MVDLGLPPKRRRRVQAQRGSLEALPPSVEKTPTVYLPLFVSEQASHVVEESLPHDWIITRHFEKDHTTEDKDSANFTWTSLGVLWNVAPIEVMCVSLEELDADRHMTCNLTLFVQLCTSFCRILMQRTAGKGRSRNPLIYAEEVQCCPSRLHCIDLTISVQRHGR